MLTHVDLNGKAKMVDISEKKETFRTAFAGGWIYLGEKIVNLIIENNIKKGDVLNTAKIAGILSAKKVGELIPLCHPLNLTFIDIKFQLFPEMGKVFVFSNAKINAPTGVEMEALTAVSVACLTIYDMCKGVDKKIYIGETYLIKKTGGKSGVFRFSEKIRGIVGEVGNKNIFDDKNIRIAGILPEHLENGDILILNGEKEINVIKIDDKVIFDTGIKLKKGDKIWLKEK